MSSPHPHAPGRTQARSMVQWDLCYPSSPSQVDQTLVRLDTLLSGDLHSLGSTWADLACLWLREARVKPGTDTGSLLLHCWAGLKSRAGTPLSSHAAQPGLTHLWASGPHFFCFPSRLIEEFVQHDVATGRWCDRLSREASVVLEENIAKALDLFPPHTFEHQQIILQQPRLRAALEHGLLLGQTPHGKEHKPRL